MTPKGTRFTKDHPYQLVDEIEVDYLLQEGRFKMASKDDLRSYYKIGEM